MATSKNDPPDRGKLFTWLPVPPDSRTKALLEAIRRKKVPATPVPEPVPADHQRGIVTYTILFVWALTILYTIFSIGLGFSTWDALSQPVLLVNSAFCAAAGYYFGQRSKS